MCTQTKNLISVPVQKKKGFIKKRQIAESLKKLYVQNCTYDLNDRAVGYFTVFIRETP